ncbi:hypothetical protein CO115_00080 [Candidatus Falkowbacteria bacterium CG_4_9_14_3_um_filter_36_9]|uniref:Shikimate kinase n=2 Tax=Candidatus Falkowiibacteriota TaxID=1752728 RepID=A0A1J4T3W1_9BACT|nr:MAG: hypothetical protein AUJ27_04035 [Candidatus Falkowbacteria bacterium CG1_02_37_44]PIV50787.1 MAG: hypothetical protein COS18_04100 [Candidatus Falkowbacteria bacterium CG02_land_8_20_14_3_00_36_14]PIX11354.1 MAG: hypothetical protein COZ73_02880 [Candidatus Falkowbacteria bacterium CG_4_8_14_3_um_filter_36_11]PJA10973.1 MAG: hypothetical protein COX67_02125 [Candidatus Falkowbacteria bacterium CG_4_10_14_0_2_um_filter_36_22]PJB20847.1 MAG: hypothetical protein CO115_00080 [Candidatus F
MSKKCILFSGAVGCSKTPTATYLSQQFDLPILSNDSIRTEILEDFGKPNENEYMKRRDSRLNMILGSGKSFILDVSIDREYERIMKLLKKYKYRHIIISFDLSKKLLIKLYKIKGYKESLKRVDSLILDHGNFIKKYNKVVNLHINDDNFTDRLNISFNKVKSFIK